MVSLNSKDEFDYPVVKFDGSFIELINERPVDVKKLKISTVDGDSNLIMTVDKKQLPKLSQKADELLYTLEQGLSKDEKLYLIAMMAEKAVGGSSEED